MFYSPFSATGKTFALQCGSMREQPFGSFMEPQDELESGQMETLAQDFR
jgi:hypothetical protein